ncbi:MAG: FAD-binding protein [Fusobacteriaceae bacterium]
MKKNLLLITGLASLLLTAPAMGKEKSTITKSYGYGGEMKVLVKTDGEKIKDIELVSHKETSPVVNRAFPVIRERIIGAQSPVVDSVSGATHTSTAIKIAVGDVMKKEGKDFGKIDRNTKAPEQPVAYLPTVKTDLLIVGSGPAGLSAAISAREAGVKNIILIEKLDILSGNGKFDMNFFDLYNSEAQKNAGIEDSVEKFLSDKKNAKETPERMRVQAEGAFVLDKWLRDMEIKLNHYYGNRGHMAEKDAYAGEHIQDKMEEKVKALGIDVRTGTAGLDLILDKGKVTGVKVQNKNNFYDIDAKAVILATGGFSANKELLAKYAPGGEKVATSNQMGATGDFVKVFEKNEIPMENMDVLSVFPFIIKESRDLTGGGDGYILVNETGKRFMNEQVQPGKSLEFAHNILNQDTFYIYDQNLYESFYRFQKHVKLGLHKKFDTLDQMAEEMGVPVANLKNTITEFNRAVRGEIQDPFREKPTKREFKTEGPFYMVEVESAIHMTKGGVVANENSEVLNKDRKAIKGLYAAGEVVSTSGAYSSSVVFGRSAGEKAAQFIKSSK